MPSTRGLTPQSIPFASIVGCLVALDRAPWRNTASSAGIVDHRASEAHGTPLMAQDKGRFDGASRTRTGDLLGAMRGCDLAREASFLALESGTVARWIPPREGADSRGLAGITFDLGTRDRPVPIHLSARGASLVTIARLDSCFSRKAALLTPLAERALREQWRRRMHLHPLTSTPALRTITTLGRPLGGAGVASRRERAQHGPTGRSRSADTASAQLQTAAQESSTIATEESSTMDTPENRCFSQSKG